MRTKKYLQFGIRQRLYQGSGCISMIPEILETEGWKRVMLIADPALYNIGVIEPIENLLKESEGVEYCVFTDIRPNPEAVTIDTKAVPMYQEFRADVMIAVGGGSTMDTAKGVAIVGDSGKKCMDFVGIPQHKPLAHHTYPMIAVPTTAGTGSDVCINAVICDEKGFKLVPSHDCLLPAYSLMDPDLLAGLPFSVAAATSVDTLTHALESYTNMNANDFTELFSLRSLELVGEAIRPFCANPAVDEYANKMSLACMYAGFSLGIASIGQDHVITHPMSEEPFHMPHGDACGMALPAVIEWNAMGCKEKYRKAYNALTKKQVAPEDFDVKMLIDWVIELNRDLNIAQNKTFEEWGYNDKEVLELMLKHPIFNNKDKTRNPDCNYPRVTRMKEFAHIIKRINYYSKVQAGKSEN
ncbi:MAG: iron-containing alcohol dehydrogenase [Lachnospiraceae bacterium]|nr:iron-containing alcohol dehydrogenase [Lachnospiraceae bacterium]